MQSIEKAVRGLFSAPQSLWIAVPIVFSLLTGTILSIARPGLLTDPTDAAYDPVELAKIGNDSSNADMALAAYQKALSIDPKLAQAYVGRATLSWEAGKKQAAFTDYQKAVDLYQGRGDNLNANKVREVIAAFTEGKNPACIPGDPEKNQCIRECLVQCYVPPASSTQGEPVQGDDKNKL